MKDKYHRLVGMLPPLDELEASVDWRKPSHPVPPVTEDIEYIDVTNEQVTPKPFPEINKGVRPLAGCLRVLRAITEDIDYIDVTNETQIPKNIKVDGQNYELAGMDPIPGHPGVVSVAYKPNWVDQFIPAYEPVTCQGEEINAMWMDETTEIDFEKLRQTPLHCLSAGIIWNGNIYKPINK